MTYNEKNSLVTKSIRRLLILGVALLIGIAIVSAFQFYNKVQQTYEGVSNAYIAMIDSQYSTEEITSIINNKEELAKMESAVIKSLYNASNIIYADNPALILEKLNKLICKNNDSKMFVTIWLGILDLNTGVLKASNAGHEFPIIKEPGKQFELYKDKHSFVIGGKKKTKYKEYELVLRPGTTLFLYTDGVPEATNSDGIRFQIDNTLDALNKNPNASVDQLINTVATSVSDFVLDAEQFDDLTMLCIEYTGQKDNNNSEG